MSLRSSLVARWSKPQLFHCFESERRRFVYDTNTNGIFELRPVESRVLAALGSADIEQRLQELDAENGRDNIDQILEGIEKDRTERGMYWGGSVEFSDEEGNCDPTRAIAHLILEVTEACNLRCKYCVYSGVDNRMRRHSSRSMSWHTARAALEYYRGHSSAASPKISFYGGEPLLRIAFLKQSIDYADSLAWDNVMYRIVTNGVALADKSKMSDLDLAFFIERGVYWQISIDGPQPIHDRNRRSALGDPSYESVCKAIERLLQQSPVAAERILLAATVAPPFDFDSIADYFDAGGPMLSGSSVHDVQLSVSLADLRGSALGEATLPTLRQADHKSSMANQELQYRNACKSNRDPGVTRRQLFGDEMRRLYHRPRVRADGKMTRTGACELGWHRLYVRTGGEFLPCERVSEQHQIGTIQSGIVPSDSRHITRAFYDGIGTRCATCWAVRLCNVCLATLDTTNLSADEIDEQCMLTRSRMSRSLRQYVEALGDGSNPPEHWL